MLQRTSLVNVSGVLSSYTDPKHPPQKLDISKISIACQLAPDALTDLLQLNKCVTAKGGTLYVTDMYRTWASQASEYAKWQSGSRKDYVAPPGESWHNAGRAIDFDIYNLNFPSPESTWLSLFWNIAQSFNWHPIIDKPDMSKSESWHFQHVGPDWKALQGKVADGYLARAAVLDCGMWLPSDPLIEARYLQAQAMRVSQQVVIPDGQVGPKTKAVLKMLGLDNLKIEDQIIKLNAMPTVSSPT